jgi:hypothetical protein
VSHEDERIATCAVVAFEYIPQRAAACVGRGGEVQRTTGRRQAGSTAFRISTSGLASLEGLASTSDRDVEYCVLAPFALAIDRLPPLLLEHDHSRVVGRVENLTYDATGRQLLASVYVTDRDARSRSGFSVGAKISKFEIRDADDPKACHAYITEAVLTDLSIVSRPINPHARVFRRLQPSPLQHLAACTLKNFDLLIAAVQNIRRQAGIIEEIAR